MAKTAIDKNTVLKIAGLANLTLSEEEVSRYQLQLNQVLNYVDQLEAVSVEAFQGQGVLRSTLLRDDEVNVSLKAETAVSQSSETLGTSFSVPRIVE